MPAIMCEIIMAGIIVHKFDGQQNVTLFNRLVLGVYSIHPVTSLDFCIEATNVRILTNVKAKIGKQRQQPLTF